MEAPPVEEVRPGLPWDVERWTASAFLRTVTRLLFSPRVAFRQMHPSGGLRGPYVFAAIGRCIAMALATATNSWGLGFDGDWTVASVCFESLWWVLNVVLFLGILFLGSGVIHLSLTLLDKQPRRFETTARSLAYATGALGVLPFVPLMTFLKPIILIAALLHVVWSIIGLRYAHETSFPIATGAILVPLLLTLAAAIALVVICLFTFPNSF